MRIISRVKTENLDSPKGEEGQFALMLLRNSSPARINSYPSKVQ